MARGERKTKRLPTAIKIEGGSDNRILNNRFVGRFAPAIDIVDSPRTQVQGNVHMNSGPDRTEKEKTEATRGKGTAFIPELPWKRKT